MSEKKKKKKEKNIIFLIKYSYIVSKKKNYIPSLFLTAFFLTGTADLVER